MAQAGRTPNEENLLRLAELRREVARLESELEVTAERPVRETDDLLDEDLCRLIISHTHDLITVHELDGTYLWISPNCGEFLGTPRDELIGTNAYLLFHPDDVERIAADHASTLDTASSRVTYRLRQGDGTYRWAETRSYTSTDSTGNERLVAITRDVHESHEAEESARKSERKLRERLVGLATTDRLTQLPNRMSGEQALHREVARRKRTGRALSVALVDVDRFKTINDQHGHLAGDRVLKLVAAAMQEAVREYDHVSRWGGEEFLVIVPEAGIDAATRIIDRVRAAIAAMETGHGAAVTVSAGVATFGDDESVESAVARADAALYAAKAGGRNRVVMAGALDTPTPE